MPIHTVVILLGVFMFYETSLAQVNRCEDEAGNVTYSDRPCGKKANSSRLDPKVNVIDRSNARSIMRQREQLEQRHKTGQITRQISRSSSSRGEIEKQVEIGIELLSKSNNARQQAPRIGGTTSR